MAIDGQARYLNRGKLPLRVEPEQSNDSVYVAKRFARPKGLI